MSTGGPIILFTGFEPSGDDHAASVIAEVLRRRPDVEVYAWGGPKMEAAGARIVRRTGGDAVMGLPGLAKIREHQRINADIARWLDGHAGRVALHVPVDSPAANFSICAMAKKRGVRVMHLVAPQIWAWGRWRIGKLRRLTDFVCCLLPFEERFFSERGVRAQFVGHPLFDAPIDTIALDTDIASWPAGSPRLALMPGSRPAEIDKNFPLLINAFRRLAARYPGAQGVVAATTERVAERLHELAQGTAAPPGLSAGWPDRLRVVVGQTDAAIRWCEVALVVSGTVTLQVARQRRPMVILYKSSPVLYNLVARWIVRTPFFSLPNLIAGREIVPELIPHFGDEAELVRHAVDLIEQPATRDAQIEAMGGVIAAFGEKNAADAAASAVLALIPGPGAGTGADAGAEAAVAGAA